MPAGITLSLGSGPPGGNVVVMGTGFGPKEIVAISFDSVSSGGRLTKPDGSFRQVVTAPNYPGNYVVNAVGIASGRHAQATFLVETLSHIDWAQFGFDHWNQRLNPYEKMPPSPQLAKSVLAWQYTTGGPIDSSPTVWDGVVYIGSHDGNLYALDAATGAKRWSYHTSYDIGNSSPAVSGGLVYFGSNEGTFYALNAGDGEKRWSYVLGSGSWLDSSPLVTSIQSSTMVIFGSHDYKPSGTLYALDAATGGKLWSFTTGASILTPPALSSIDISKGAIIFGSYDGNVYALDASSGTEMWSFNSGGGQFYGGPAVTSVFQYNPTYSMIYIGSLQGNVYALDQQNGSLRWKYTTNGPIGSSPSLIHATYYIDGTVYIGSMDGNVYALSAWTGAKLWSYSVGKVVNSSPAVANGVVYVGTGDGAIYALDAATGAKLWSYTTGAQINQSSPAVVNDMVYIGSYDHNVYAFQLTIGGQ